MDVGEVCISIMSAMFSYLSVLWQTNSLAYMHIYTYPPNTCNYKVYDDINAGCGNRSLQFYLCLCAFQW